MQTMSRLIFTLFLTVGLATGCATFGDPAESAIDAAKEANAKAKSVNYEWRDTGKIIKKAEKALADGKSEEAIKLANKAKKQAENAVAQQKAESARVSN